MFKAIFYTPLLNVLVFLYETIGVRDLGISIILLTLLVRLILYPLFYKSFKHQALLQKIQPHVKALQEEHKHDREKQAKALLELYREHKINPFSGFLLLLVQLPVLFALYRVFLGGLSVDALKDLYSFIPNPGVIHSTLLGLIDLAHPSIIIVGLAAITQYFQGRLTLPAASIQGDAKRMLSATVFLGPVLTLLILPRLPAAIGLYWIITSLFSIVQQVIIKRSMDTK